MIAHSTFVLNAATSRNTLKAQNNDSIYEIRLGRASTNSSLQTCCSNEDVSKLANFAASADSLLNLCQEDTDDRLSTNGSSLSRTSTPMSKELLETDPFDSLERWMTSSVDEKEEENLLLTVCPLNPNSNIFEGMEDRVMGFLNSEGITMMHPGQDKICEVKRPHLAREVIEFSPKRNSLACRRAMTLKVTI